MLSINLHSPGPFILGPSLLSGDPGSLAIPSAGATTLWEQACRRPVCHLFRAHRRRRSR